MGARVVRAGIAGGIAGGMVMAAFSMIAMWLAGSGFWTPLNLIAQAFTAWVFAVAHLLFGMLAASFAALAITDEESPYQPGHRRPTRPTRRA
jgi:hypothetical protein